MADKATAKAFAQPFHGHVDSNLGPVAKTIDNCSRGLCDGNFNALDPMANNAFGERSSSETHKPDSRVVDLGPPRRPVDCHPDGRWHLQCEFVELKSRSETDNALGNEHGGFSKHMARVDLCVPKLVKTTSRANNRFLPDKASQRFRSNPFGHEILQPEHPPGLQEIECATSLGACGRHWE